MIAEGTAEMVAHEFIAQIKLLTLLLRLIRSNTGPILPSIAANHFN